jgi:hypothetical protein
MTTPREELVRRAAAGEEGAALALADAFDAEGRHNETIDLLARAAQRGGLEAKARVAARILVGDRAPALPAQGAGLVEDAARQGGATGAALLAVLAAAGAYRKQSWSEGLDWLQRAAERGHEGARRQLAILCRDAELTEEALAAEQSGADAKPDLWRRLRAAIDVAALLEPPAVQAVSADPVLQRFPGFASPQECDWLIARAAEKLRRAEVYHDAKSRGAVSQARTNSLRTFTLVETDVVQLVLQARMARAAGVRFTHLEGSSVLHYSVGEEFVDHYDFVDPSTPDYEQHLARHGQRMTTFLIYLNDDYEGGETDFPRLGVKHKGVRGEGFLFVNAFPAGEPDERMLHAGRPPTRGEKWLASQFIRSKPIVPGA